MALTKEQKALKAAYIDEVVAESFGESWRKYFNSSIDRVVKLEDGRMIAIEKPSIHKEFCFGYHTSFPGYNYDEANHMARYANESENYFMSENMRQINDKIEDLNRSRSRWTPKSAIQYNGAKAESKVCYLKWYDAFDEREWEHKDTDRDVTDEDMKKIMAAYEETKADFEKRLNTYLKKYGMNHVRTWTYWADA